MKSLKFLDFLFVIFFITLVIDFNRFGIPENFQSVFKGGVIALIILVFLIKWSQKPFKPKLSLFVKAFLALVVVSLFYTVNFKESLTGIVVLFSTILLLLLARRTFSLTKIFQLIRIACTCIILFSFCLYIFRSSSSYDFLQGKERFAGITYGAHPLASISVFFILITAINYRFKLSTRFFVDNTMLLIALLMITEADSRQAVIGLVIALLFLVWHRINLLSKVFLFSFSILTIIFISQGVEKEKFLKNQSRTSTSEEVTTLTGRTAIWLKSIEIIKNKPVLGNGYNAGQFELENNYQTMHGWSTRSAHNFLLHTGLDLGLIGILLILYGVISTFKAIYKFHSKLAFSILLYCLIISFVERGFAGGVNIYSFIFLLANLYIPNLNNHRLQDIHGK